MLQALYGVFGLKFTNINRLNNKIAIAFVITIKM